MSVVSPTRTALQPARILNTARTNLIRPTQFAKMSSAPNFNFPERQATSEEKALIDDVLQLCKWSPNRAFALGRQHKIKADRRPAEAYLLGIRPIRSFGYLPRSHRSRRGTRGCRTSFSRDIQHQADKQKAQFNSMPKVFASSETKALKVLDNPAVVSCVRLHTFDRTSPRLKSHGPTDEHEHPLIPATPFHPVLPFAAVQAQGDQLGKARRVAYHPPR